MRKSAPEGGPRPSQPASASASLLRVLQSGAQLWVEDGELRFRAPRGALTPELREDVARHRPAIISLLGDRARYAPPSFAQERMWLLDRSDLPRHRLSTSVAVRLTGPLEMRAVERSLGELATGHEILRTRFPSLEGQAVQVVDEPTSLEEALPTVDLGDRESSKREEEVTRLVEAEAHRPFDLGREPPWRARLLRTGADEHVLLLTIHRIAVDGRSMGVLVRDLGALYEAISLETRSSLTDLPIQCADFAAWQRRWLRDEALDERLSYWREQLAGTLPQLALPTDRPAPAVRAFRGARRSLTLPESLTSALRELADSEGVTLFVTLLAAFKALLHGWSGADAIVVGSAVAGRALSGTEDLIGPFANTLALRTDLAGDPTFAELAHRVHQVTARGREHGDLPFEKLVEELEPERYTDSAPPLRVTFALEDGPDPALERAGVTFEPLAVGGPTLEADLTLRLTERSGCLDAALEYDSELFEPTTVDRVGERLRRLLEAVVDDPDLPLSGLIPSEAAEGDTRPRRRARLEDRGVDLEEMETALLEDPSIEDCAVLPRETASGETVLVAYAVVSRDPPAKRLGERVREKLPGGPVPAVYVPVSNLPLTETGALDGAALSRVAVIDDGLARRWEEHLRSLPGVEGVAVLAEETRASPASLPLDELLPGRTPPARPVTSRDGPSGGSAEDRPVALAAGSRLRIPDDAPRTLTEALLRTAREHSEKGITYVRSDGSETFESYARLLERARHILAGLQERGLRPGDRAILQVDALEDHYATFWACVLGGIAPATVAVPLSYGARNAVVDKLWGSWELLGHPSILTSPQLIESVAGLGRLYPMEDLTIYPVDELEESPPTDDLHDSQPDDVAFLQLTSGSTGVPKCIKELHRSIIAHAHGLRQADGYGPDEVTLNWMPVDHVGTILFYHLKDTYLGCRQVHVKTDLILGEPLRWLDLLETHHAARTWSPNFGYKLVADRLATATDRHWDLSRVRFLNGGEQATLAVIREFLSRVAPFGVREQAMQPAFGMAETCTVVASHDRFDVRTGARRFLKSSLGGLLQETDDDDAETVTFIELGPPIPGVQLRIVDSENELLPEGVIGRFQIKGPVVTPGYLHNDAGNQEAFVGDGWFNSGDLGFLLDGRLSLTGREKETIIVRGANFYCHEIEGVVGEVEGVEPTFVGACAVADPATGTEGLAVFFVPRAGADDVDEIVQRIRARVASGIGIAPTHVVALAAGDFPKTTSGKIQRAQLRRELESGRFQDGPGGLDATIDDSASLPDWFYRRTWRRRDPPPERPRRSAGRKTLVLLDRAGLGASLVERERQGRPWFEVDAGTGFEEVDENRFRIDPRRPDDYRRLLDALGRDGVGVEEIVHLWTYGDGAGPVADLAGLEAAQERGASSLLLLLQALAAGHPPDRPLRLVVASANAQQVLPDDEVACEHGPLLGLIRTAMREWPWLECSHVDLPAERLDTDADAVLRELRAVRGDPEVAYRAGRRRVPSLEHVDLRREDAHPLPFEHGGLYLVTGGLGGLGGEVAQYLLEHFEARLLLLGRTSLPEPDSGQAAEPAEHGDARLATYRTLGQLGGEVLYRSADVADPARLATVVAEAEALWGRPLDGVLHLAGVFEERPLADETHETLMESLRPKLQGTWALHEVARDRPGCAFVTFSSVNGTLGGFGAGAYAAASAFLDGFAHHRRRMGLPSSCFAWSLWDAAGMARALPPAQRELSRTRGFIPIAAEQGVNSLLAGLRRDQTHLLVGLDAARAHVGRHVDRPAEGTRTLRAYVSGGNDGESGQGAAAFHPPDRFGTPTSCGLVSVQALPVAATGATDRAALRELGAFATPEQARPERREPVPRTPAEKEVAEVWADVLGVGRVSLDDDLFELGGNPVLAARIVGRLNRRFGVELPSSAVLESPTVVGHALALIRERSEPPILPLSSQQRHLWSKEHDRPGMGSAHAIRALRVHGRLDVVALEAALTEICVRHEVLRTTFHARGGDSVQIVRSPLPVRLFRVDLSGVPSPAREGEADRLLSREARRPFDLSRDRMLRATLVRVADEEHLVLLVVHHIASDERSLEILDDELQELYEAARAGRRAGLPKLGVQYPDYAVWQRQELAAGELRESLEYWKGRLAGAPREIVVPTDHPRPAAPAAQSAWQEMESAALMTELQALSRREGVTSFMTILAAWTALLHLYSGHDDIVVVTPFANRGGAEVQRVIGFFASNLFLRHDVSGDPSFAELLARVRRTTTDAFSHGGLTYHEIPAELRPKVQFALLARGATDGRRSFDGLAVERIDSGIDRGEKWFLAVVTEGSGAHMRVRLNYDPARFDAATAAGIARDLRALLEGVIADPDRRLSTLSVAVPARPRSGGSTTGGKPPGTAPLRGKPLRRVRRIRKRLRRITRRVRKRLRRITRFDRKRVRRIARFVRRRVRRLSRFAARAGTRER